MRDYFSQEDFQKLFNARSLAIIGASENQEKIGYQVINTILKGEYSGKIYPVNPRGGETLGLKFHQNIIDLPDGIELAVIAIKARLIPETLLQLSQKGTRAFLILSAGFRESGYPELEKEIVQIAKDNRLVFLGPNIQGVYCPHNKMSAAFFPAIHKPGPVSIISQSGSVTAYLAEQFEIENIGISAAVNLGNKALIDETDLLEYFAQDQNTKTIALYLESIRDGERFLEIVQKTLPYKSIAIMKSGRTETGKKSAESHTGSLAGNDTVFDAACRQFGLFRALTMESLFDAVKGLALIKQPSGNRIMTVSSSGGGNTLAVDAAEEYKLNIPPLSAAFKDEVKEKMDLPVNAGIANPFDLALLKNFHQVVKIADKHNIADTYLLNYGDPIETGIEEALELRKVLQGSLAVAYFGGGELELKGRYELQEKGIPVFPTPERAITGIAAAINYADYRKKFGGNHGNNR